jgi:predicted ATPase
MNLNKGISFDFETIQFLCSNFKRKSFLDKLDDYRCENNYMNKLWEYKFDSRIEQFEETIKYIMKKKQNKQPIKIHNIHFLSIHESEEMLYPERIEKY